MITTIVIAIGALLAGVSGGYVLLQQLLKSRIAKMIQEAEAEGEVIKKDKILQAKEKFLSLKTEHEKQANARNAKILAMENRIKEQQNTLRIKSEDLARKEKELEQLNDSITAQIDMIDKKRVDLEKLHKQAVEQLETISGLSGEEAKERLVESIVITSYSIHYTKLYEGPRVSN